MNRSPFHGRWICAREFADCCPINVFHRECESPTLPEHPEKLKNFHMTVRKTFDSRLFENAKQRLIRITADDYFKLYLNQQFVGQGPAPGYYFSYYYNEFDIAPYLRSGENQIEIRVYYQGLINRVWNSGDLRQGVIADLLADNVPVLWTDSSWQYARNGSYIGKRTTGYETLYLEDVDSRIPLTQWASCAEKETDYTFYPKPFPALSVSEISPVKVIHQPDGLFLDFGQEITGNLKIQAFGTSGKQIVIECGEELDESGQVRWDMRCNCQYREFWTLKEGENLLEQYDYKGFRYVQLRFPSDVSIHRVLAVVRHFPFPENSAQLTSENPVLEQVFNLCKNTVQYGSQESFIDCPTREKGQYTGDLTITGASQLLLTGDPRLLRRAIDLQVDSLSIAPGMMAVVPGSFMQEIADYSLQFPLSVWRYYQYTGDRTFLSEMVKPCENILTYFSQYARQDGLLEGVREKWNLVDWPKNLRDGYDFPLTIPIGPGCHNVINGFYIGCVMMVEKIKAELGIPYTKQSEHLQQAFNKAFFRPSLGRYVDHEHSSHSSIHANCIPAFYGLIPAGYEKQVGDYLVHRGMVCGVYMAFFLLKGLARLDRYEDVWKFLVSTGDHSWYNMIRQGATTCFEAWGAEQKWNTSLCHPWASAPVSVLIEDLAGLCPTSPGKGWSFHPHFPSSAGKIHLKVPTTEGVQQLEFAP
ncbi:MAG: family 78 glycoside hydrolase catalytic domain [Massiliimalia sp.]|jgi:alpha-L-rhamnosidase